MTTKIKTNNGRLGWALGLLMAVVALGALGFGVIGQSARATAGDTGTVDLNTAHEGTMNSTFKQGACPTPPAGQEDWFGWHFLMPNNANFTSLSVTFATAGTISANPFPGTAFVASPDNSHAYVWTETDDTLLSGTATYVTTGPSTPTMFNLSHTCAGGGAEPPETTLNVTKTADGSFTRTHRWLIAKSVSPAVFWLYTNGSGDGTATWTVNVTHGGYADSDFSVSGTVTIENPNDSAVMINSVADDLGNGLGAAALTCEDGNGDPVTFPASLASLATISCTYDEALTDAEGAANPTGTNTVTVNWTDADDVAKQDGDTDGWAFSSPTTEVNATVSVSDASSLLGSQSLGTVAAPNNGTFTYTHSFTWAGYGRARCGNYNYPNTATLTGDNAAILGTASATVAVHVQCFVGETAWAANEHAAGQLRYNTRGNWATYVIYVANKASTLFAGQTMNAGTVAFSTVASGNVTIAVTLAAPWSFVPGSDNLMVQGYAAPPTGNPSPGLFANKKVCGGSPCSITVPAAAYYGVHANVERPDPNFGP